MSSSSVAATSKLACVRCQSRKVKCNRHVPCSNCVRASAECVPATLAPRQRRRRFPERELLDRLRGYEGLLRRHNIEFEPLHPSTAEKTPPSEGGRTLDFPLDVRSDTSVKSETVYEAKNLWRAINQKAQDYEDGGDENRSEGEDTDGASSHGDLRPAVIKKAWSQFVEGNDNLLFFGSGKSNADLSTLHPQPGQIFRLWQIYLENVDPLLKVTHTPTLQARIVDAASNVSNVSSTLEALMFSIYSVSVMGLVDEECLAMFGSSKDLLLKSYRHGCQQALLECGFLRCGDRDCLTALYLYLMSVRSECEPGALSAVLGAAIRLAQRMGIHNESTNVKCTPFEAEMRRRLWWALVILDNRVSEMSDSKATVLNPTWDCRTPFDINDFDMRLEMKNLPALRQQPGEALFPVLRSELADFIRNSAAHLDFTSPSLKSLAKDTHYHGDMDAFETRTEERLRAFCSAENPLHFMTMWTIRYFIAKYRLLEYYSRCASSSVNPTNTQRNAAMSHAERMLECNTKLATSLITKGYLWLLNFDFPFPAYIHILQDLKKRPLDEQAGRRVWETVSDNYEANFHGKDIGQDPNPLFNNPLFQLFSRMVLQAWEALEAVLTQPDQPLEIPRIVSDIRHKMMQTMSNARDNSIGQPKDAGAVSVDNYPMPMPIDFGNHGLPYGVGVQGMAWLDPNGYPDMSGQTSRDSHLDQFDWATMDWNPMCW